MRLLTLLPPAFAEVRLNLSFVLPRFFGFSFTRTVLVAPAAIAPARLVTLTPLPLTLSPTPVALAFPELVILTLKVALLPFLTLAGPLTLTLLILALRTVVSTLKVRMAGVPSRFPAASVALTAKV